MKIELKVGDKEDEKRFEYIYNGFIIGGSITQTKGMVALRREIGILDKLCSISKNCECGKKIIGDEEMRELTGGVIEIDRAEFDMIHNYMSSVPWSTGKSVRDAVATIDWLATL